MWERLRTNTGEAFLSEFHFILFYFHYLFIVFFLVCIWISWESSRFIRKISLPSLCKGKNRSQLQCLDQNHSISIAKPSPTPTYLYDFKAQVFLDSTSHLLPGERRSRETYIAYREFMTLEFENSESPAYNQLELEVPLNCWMCQPLFSLPIWKSTIWVMLFRKNYRFQLYLVMLDKPIRYHEKTTIYFYQY